MTAGLRSHGQSLDRLDRRTLERERERESTYLEREMRGEILFDCHTTTRQGYRILNDDECGDGNQDDGDG